MFKFNFIPFVAKKKKITYKKWTKYIEMMPWLRNFGSVSLHWLCRKMPELIVHVLFILATPFATPFLFLISDKQMNTEGLSE